MLGTMVLVLPQNISKQVYRIFNSENTVPDSSSFEGDVHVKDDSNKKIRFNESDSLHFAITDRVLCHKIEADVSRSSTTGILVALHTSAASMFHLQTFRA